MLSVALALALFAQDQAAGSAPAPAAPAAAADPIPNGAPRDDYQFVAWCYGALRGYVDLHDEVMPEVTRIESTYRRPGSKLEDDLKVYADMQKDARSKLKMFQSALTAAEKASVQPINTQGAAAVAQGRKVWAGAASVSKARLAQEWMSWVPPLRCEKTASTLETRSKLMGSALKANAGDSAAAPPTEEKPAT